MSKPFRTGGILSLAVLSVVVACWMLSQAASAQPEIAPRQVASRPVTQPATQISAGRLDKASDLWRQGDEAGARAEFLRIAWKGIGVADANSIFLMTEKEYTALSPAQRKAKYEQIDAELKPLRELCRKILAEGKEAAGKKNTDIARAGFEAVAGCGGFLAAEQRLSILQVVGRGLQRAAADELLKTSSPAK